MFGFGTKDKPAPVPAPPTPRTPLEAQIAESQTALDKVNDEYRAAESAVAAAQADEAAAILARDTAVSQAEEDAAKAKLFAARAALRDAVARRDAAIANRSLIDARLIGLLETQGDEQKRKAAADADRQMTEHAKLILCWAQRYGELHWATAAAHSNACDLLPVATALKDGTGIRKHAGVPPLHHFTSVMFSEAFDAFKWQVALWKPELLDPQDPARLRRDHLNRVERAAGVPIQDQTGF